MVNRPGKVDTELAEQVEPAAATRPPGPAREEANPTSEIDASATGQVNFRAPTLTLHSPNGGRKRQRKWVVQ